MNSLKHDIAVLAAEQPILRDQRKSVHNKLERTFTPQQASSKHSANRADLRLLYAVQQLLKGVPIEEIEKSNRPTTTPLTSYKAYLEKLVDKYGEVAHTN